MVRVGLCCTFLEAPIKMRTTTARYAGGLAADVRRAFLQELVVHNARTLERAIEWCANHGVGAFRINSGIVPLATHPELGYSIVDDDFAEARAIFGRAGELARDADIRLSFHPDQFVVPGSANPQVVESSLQELEHQARVAELVGAEQLTIHGGGARGGKPAALERLAVALDRLSARARSRVVLENDDTTYTVEDLLPICEKLAIPLVYDVHHHRCNPDSLTVEAATAHAAATWGDREPWAHLSSPIEGWQPGTDHRPHADYIDDADVPACWLGRRMTIDIEAKAKELAVLSLNRWFHEIAITRATAGIAPRGRGTVAA